MRSMRHFPQMPQIPLSDSNCSGGSGSAWVRFHSFAARPLQPRAKFVLPESPLAPNFDGRKFMAFRPEANRAGGDSQPFCNRSRSQ